ncbi:hypothetical protein PYV02_10875 [Leifsonia sp. H3M29-4]|uniref:hypothetical protein n=1 Tax=Salinibacterium metalliresistens TaxID=3031321 RepID=UPI0023DC4B22|nr:hypothetical protein [Salinibacterium metalliresistens]MDF1479585.1 hypothetical protein [Salinibacterium metalliresistens]
MQQRTRTTIAKTLAILGTVLVGIPLAAPIVFGIAFLIARGGLHLDVLMPGELFVLVFIGGALLLASSLLARRQRWTTGVLLAAAVLFLAVMAWAAQATGLASGRTAAEGWPLALVTGVYALYVAATIGLFVVGVLLCRALFARSA